MNFDLFTGWDGEDSGVIFGLVFPLNLNSDEVLSFGILFVYLWVYMDTFGPPEAIVIAFRQECDLSGWLYPAELENDRGILVSFIVKHSVKLLDESQIYLLVLV